jgi:hypothetical protein
MYISYVVPTFFPAIAGAVAATGGAPTINLADADLKARAQRMINVLFWARAAAAASDSSAIKAALADASTLKVFIAPEFYFRKATPADGASGFDRTRNFWGSYPEEARYQLAEALYGAIQPQAAFKDWTVVAGTICSFSAEPNPARLLNTALVLRGQRSTMDESVPYTLIEKHYFSWIDLDYRDANNDLWNVRRSLTSVFSERKNPDFVLDNLIRWDNMLQGVEVCLDHSESVLATGLRLLGTVFPPAPTVNLQLVTSCGMSLNPLSAGVAEGGLMLLTDGMPTGGGGPPRAQLARLDGTQPDGLATTQPYVYQVLPSNDPNLYVTPSQDARQQGIWLYEPVTLQAGN